MKLFFKARKPAEPTEGASEPANSAPPPRPCATSQISLSAEEKNMLDQPINPRVSQILDQIANKATPVPVPQPETETPLFDAL